MNKEELSAMTIAELKALAKKRKVAISAGAKKAEIIRSLAKASPKAAGKPAARKAAAKRTAKKTLSGKKSAAKPAGKAAKKTAAKKSAAKPAVKTAKKTAAKHAAARRVSRKSAAVKAAGQTPALREWRMPAGIEGPREGQERVSDAKFYTGTPERKPPMPYDTLPHEYGSERITVLARDPFMAFCYWELPQERLEKEKAWFGWDSKLCVRVYDVSGVQFNGSNASAYFDQEVYERVGSWYFDLGRPAHTFCVDLGLMAPNGRFQTLIRSNTVTMPREGVSDVLDEEWMLVEEEFMKLYGIPGTAGAGRGIHGGLSSAETKEILRQRRLLEITSPGTFSRKRETRKK